MSPQPLQRRGLITTHDLEVNVKDQSTEQQTVDAFNAAHPVGTVVRYWCGVREGAPSGVGPTRSLAYVLSGHTAVVFIEGTSGCIALSHVEPVTPLRDLIRAARAAGWDHSTAAYSNGRGRPTLPLEHIWERGTDRVSYLDGELMHWRDDREALRARVDSVEQAVALLSAYGLPAVAR